MQITDVSVFTVRGSREVAARAHGNRQSQQLDIYPEFGQRGWGGPREAGVHAIAADYVEIRTDEGISGLFGPIDESQRFVIERHLTSFLIGRDPLAIEALSDQMLRLHRHGRSGLFMTGISAVDCALWDLKGKAWNQPLYRLLGGPTRPSVPAYASMLGHSIDPEQAAHTALVAMAEGYPAQKWFFRYGPGDGEDGKAKNLALVAAVREALGPHYPLMMDAFMGWDLTYAREMLRLLEPYNLTWMEEPFPPERVGSFAKLKAETRVPLATGEHVYTRWQVKELLAAGAVDFIQTDPDWCGGITELVKICALASSYDIPVVAHGHSLLAALHLAGAQSPSVVPYVEYLCEHQAHKQFFHETKYEPVRGHIALPEAPGLGIILDHDRWSN
jgi:L-alanine-DL-glutamate epimerase-like enolase superfamily enzyme